MIPCYNEVENVEAMYHALTRLFESELPCYSYELLFVDNHSDDGTREILQRVCQEDEHVGVIINARNFGVFQSSYYGLLQTRGDCAISIACDFQEPVEVIPSLIQKWQDGAQVVAAVQEGSKENKLVYGLRSLFYRVMKKGSGINYISHFTGFGLYDRSFLELLRELDDPAPFLRGMVAELGSSIAYVPYIQPKRKHGKSHHSVFDLYDAAMLSFTSYTTMGLRVITMVGFVISLLSFIVGMVYLIYKLVNWYKFNAGMAPVLIGMFFLGSVVLVVLGILGEYLISMNRRIMHRPLVIEAERLGAARNHDRTDQRASKDNT